MHSLFPHLKEWKRAAHLLLSLARRRQFALVDTAARHAEHDNLTMRGYNKKEQKKKEKKIHMLSVRTSNETK